MNFHTVTNHIPGFLCFFSVLQETLQNKFPQFQVHFLSDHIVATKKESDGDLSKHVALRLLLFGFYSSGKKSFTESSIQDKMIYSDPVAAKCHTGDL